ncbi:MAG: methionyl-tRNA formyltransferase [Pirellulales bacterium]|nr:methionyl-tRNA formyltransferase [Pirellulales bacterium]
MSDSLRILTMGTGPFAVPMFRALLGSSHQRLGLVTRPDRPVHRRQQTPLNPMREVAHEHRLDVFEPENINSPAAQAWLHEKAADLFVVCDYGQILSRATLGLARLGGVNLHASLLPKFRGAAPINWAIYHGETETGVTVIHMTPQLDAGPCLVQKWAIIGPEETTPELEIRLAELGVGAVLEAVELLARGKVSNFSQQDPIFATKAPRLRKEDGQVDWTRGATAIFNQVRALQPWPNTYTHWLRPNAEPMRIILEKVKPLPVEATMAIAPGTIVEAAINSNSQVHAPCLKVACGEGLLLIDILQPAGKRAMAASEFLRGHAVQTGQQLGNP